MRTRDREASIPLQLQYRRSTMRRVEFLPLDGLIAQRGDAPTKRNNIVMILGFISCILFCIHTTIPVCNYN